MRELERHRAVVDAALRRLGLSWGGWPELIGDPRLEPDVRLSAALLLLSETTSEGPAQVTMVVIGEDDLDQLDWLQRARHPWEALSRARLPWTAETAATAVGLMPASRGFDDRCVGLALRGARDVCAAGGATAALLDALRDCIAWLDRVDEQWGVTDMCNLARRVLLSATPPEILDLSLLVDGDAWAGPARRAARSLPADEVTPLVRLLGTLGPRRPPASWSRSAVEALRPEAARELLRQWLELAAVTDIVPSHPQSVIGLVPGTLFVGTNADVVRAAVWATSTLTAESWPAGLLGALARRGSAHNGMAGIPEALALKVATAAVDALALRAGDADRSVLVELSEDLRRRDLLKKVTAALG